MIKVLVEKHEKPKKEELRQYIFECSHCASIIQVDEEDIDCDICWDDINEWVKCPVCLHHNYVGFGWRLSHAKNIYKLFHKIQ